MTPKWKPPIHLRPLISRLESWRQRRPENPLRLIVSTPPRHSKTETLLHFLARETVQDPELLNGYVTYGADLAEEKSNRIRNIVQREQVALNPKIASAAHWQTAQGGGLYALGVGGPLTGRGITGILVIDDPIKNRVEAESSATRKKIREWFNDVAYTRLEPGAACVIVMTRWHTDDLAGSLTRKERREEDAVLEDPAVDDTEQLFELRDGVVRNGWEVINLPAISPTGVALWPERWPMELLREKRRRVGEYTWASLYQGTPRPRGEQLFGDNFKTYQPGDLPTSGVRTAFGLDLAYSKKTTADYSVIVTMLRHGGLFYVVDVWRRQIGSSQFRAAVRSRWSLHPTAKGRWYCAGAEQGIEDLIIKPQQEGERRLPAFAVPTTADKFTRAQPFAAAWNAGKVLIPADAPWVEDYLSELQDFTGVNDAHDDQVDSSVGAYDLLDRKPAKYGDGAANAGARRPMGGLPMTPEEDDAADDAAPRESRRGL